MKPKPFASLNHLTVPVAILKYLDFICNNYFAFMLINECDWIKSRRNFRIDQKKPSTIMFCEAHYTPKEVITPEKTSNSPASALVSSKYSLPFSENTLFGSTNISSFAVGFGSSAVPVEPPMTQLVAIYHKSQLPLLSFAIGSRDKACLAQQR
jgi:hypothetical protein